jgi:hypothetical protein
MSEADNIRHWNDDRGVYEVYYLTWNHPGTDQGFWLRYITEAPRDGIPHAELWFARFDPAHPERTFGIHRPFSWSSFQSAAQPFSVKIADATLTHDRAVGSITGDGHTASWDLRWNPADQVLRLLPDVMYGGGGRGETTVVSPNPRVPMSGTVTVDGERLDFDRAVLGQTHLWGKKHAFSWAWGRCAEFTGADAVLELLGVRLQRRGVTLPPMMLVALDLDGERYRLNQFRHVPLNRGRWAPGNVSFTARSATVKIEGELVCGSDDMLVAPYLDPDGTEVFCMNTEIGDARAIVYKRAGLGWREFRRLEGRRRAHFEVGGRSPDPSVPRWQVRVGE